MGVYDRPNWSNVCSILPNSSLHEAFTRRGLATSQVRLKFVHQTILGIIFREGVLSRGNLIYFCTQEMENILKTKVLHVRQLEAALHVSLHLWSTPPILDITSLPLFTSATMLWNMLPPVDTTPGQDNEPKYLLDERLRLLCASVGVCGPPTRFVTLRQARHMLTNYIGEKITSLVDVRNMDIVILAHDPLGELFSPVKAIHWARDSMNLIAKHLIPVGALPPKKRILT